MQVTFGIDVSKSTSTICELIGESKNELTITNDHPGFIQLLKELSAFSKHPQIIFEATGVYSRRLQAFLEDYDYDYVIINPLKAKKEMDLGLRHNKTDKTDAYHLALIQRLHHHPVNHLQSQTYKQLNSLSRFYDQLTSDLVMAKIGFIKLYSQLSLRLKLYFVLPKAKIIGKYYSIILIVI